MSLRGKAAIIGISQIPTQREIPGAITKGLLAQVARMAMEDARLRKEHIDGLITGVAPAPFEVADYIGLRPAYFSAAHAMGASGALSIILAAAAINAGLCNYVLCVFGGVSAMRLASRADAPARPPPGVPSEFEAPYGPVIAATTPYALMARRHMYEYGTTPEQFAKCAVDERFNAVTNPNAVFQGQPITMEDVLNSRFIADPLHLLECVMPCDGACAVIVTSAERAKSGPHRPVYILGAAGVATQHIVITSMPRLTDSMVKLTGRRAFEMSGYGPGDMEFAEFYD